LCWFFIPIILPFFLFSSLFLSYLKIIYLVVNFASILNHSQLFYYFPIPDNSKLLHNNWTISLHIKVLFICSHHTSLLFPPSHHLHSYLFSLSPPLFLLSKF
jgi:hypothetical protein